MYHVTFTGGGGYIFIGAVVGVCLRYFIYYYDRYIFLFRSNLELWVSVKL
jgi:hypothetical protein